TLDALVLDVKFGSGAFMKTREEAVSLAAAMRDVGMGMGVRVETRLNPMDAPLGHTVGNALEVQEAIETLQGGGPAELRELTLDLASAVSVASRATLAGWIDDGSAWEKFIALVEAQGGDPTSLQRLLEVHHAPVIRTIEADVEHPILDADTIGRASLALGAGRARADDEIDFAVGFSDLGKDGRLGTIHARTEADADAAEAQLRAAQCD
ncbi:MAG: hypothetical protein AAGJ83_16405, partial [Planctomycetota bacterium]